MQLIQADELIHDQLDSAQEQMITIEETNKDTRCSFRVAPSWGKLTKDSIITMDNHLKILLAITFRNIEKFVRDNGQDNLSWEKLVELMEQNVIVERKNVKELNVKESKQRDETNWFKFDGSPNEVIRDGVIRWIRESIQDPELLNIIGEEAMLKIANIFAETVAAVDSFLHFFANNETHEYTLLDVGIIRTPDITKPYLQLFRIKIYVKRYDQRVFFVQNDTNTLYLEANTRDYVPREYVMSSISQKVMAKAIEETNKMMEDLFGEF